MDLTTMTRPVHGGWEVSLSVRLLPQEVMGLFMAGDKLIVWPAQEHPTTPVAPGHKALPRTAMFLSEIAGRGEDLVLLYGSEELAWRVAEDLESQIRAAVMDVAGS